MKLITSKRERRLRKIAKLLQKESEWVVAQGRTEPSKRMSEYYTWLDSAMHAVWLTLGYGYFTIEDRLKMVDDLEKTEAAE